MTRALVLGGTGFVGPSVVRQLVDAGHDVTIFHRGEHEAELPETVRHIHGERDKIGMYRGEIASLRPDVVIDMRAMTMGDARTVADAIRGTAPRLVVLSSMDVYRAYGRLHGTEPGAPMPPPFDEQSPLRENLFVYRDQAGTISPGRPPWLNDYEKILVERTVMNDPEFTGTVVRFPMVHGERDDQRRFYWLWKRMADERDVILMSEKEAAFRASRTYVDNAAYAVVLAATDDRARGRVYNVGEPDALATIEWVRSLAQIVGWRGELVMRPSDELPEHLRDRRPDIWDHHLVVDTTRIRSELQYGEIRSRDEGLRRTIAWYDAVPPTDAKRAGNLEYEAEDSFLVTFRRSAVH